MRGCAVKISSRRLRALVGPGADLHHLDEVDGAFTSDHLHVHLVAVLGREDRGGVRLGEVGIGHFETVRARTAHAGDIDGVVHVQEGEGDVAVLFDPPAPGVAVVGGSACWDGDGQQDGGDDGSDDALHDQVPFGSVVDDVTPENGAFLGSTAGDEV